MNKKILLGLIILIIIVASALYVFINSKKPQSSKTNPIDTTRTLDTSLKKQMDNQKDELGCENDNDCKFVFTKMEYSCPSCSYESDNWVCMNKESAEQEWIEWSKQHSDVQCEMCLKSESDFDNFECKCSNNSCAKNRK